MLNTRIVMFTKVLINRIFILDPLSDTIVIILSKIPHSIKISKIEVAIFAPVCILIISLVFKTGEYKMTSNR